MTLSEIRTSASISDMLSVIRTSGSKELRGAAFKRIGQIAQDQVGKLAEEVLEEVAEELILDGLVSISGGPGATTRFDGSRKRVLDFYAAAGDFFADIEVKYGLPKRGSEAMRRLLSQARSMRRGPNASRVIILMSDNVSDASISKLRRSLSGARAGPVEILHGAEEVTQFFRKFFLR
jgi:hypothetical protein